MPLSLLQDCDYRRNHPDNGQRGHTGLGSLSVLQNLYIHYQNGRIDLEDKPNHGSSLIDYPSSREKPLRASPQPTGNYSKQNLLSPQNHSYAAFSKRADPVRPD